MTYETSEDKVVNPYGNEDYVGILKDCLDGAYTLAPLETVLNNSVIFYAWFKPTAACTIIIDCLGKLQSTYIEANAWTKITVINEEITKKNVIIYPLTNGSIYLYEASLQSGTKPTEWTPATEDVESRVSYNESRITQTAGLISLVVANETAETKIELQPGFIQETADKINLKGLVSFSGLNEETKAKINNTYATDTLYYLATSASSGVTVDTSGWTTTPQSVTATNKYLWTYHKYTTTGGGTVNSAPCITGVYGDTGAKGDKGDTGAKGDTGSSGKSVVESIPLYYCTTSTGTINAPTSYVTSTSTAVNQWTRVTPDYTKTYCYIYTCNQTKYSDSTVAWSSVTMDRSLSAVAGWCSKENKTLIDGDSIFTGSISAEKIKCSEIDTVGEISTGSIKLGNDKFVVTSDGTLSCKDATVKGDITAKTLLLNSKNTFLNFDDDSLNIIANDQSSMESRLNIDLDFISMSHYDRTTSPETLKAQAQIGENLVSLYATGAMNLESSESIYLKTNNATVNGNPILTSASTLNAAKLSGTVPSSCYTNTTYSAATTSANGLMSSTDKTKLNAIADYVKEQGTTSTYGWYYRKWNSGKVEAWRLCECNAECTKSYGNLYYQENYANIDSGIFNSIDHIQCTVYATKGLYFVSTYAFTNTRINFYIASAKSDTRIVVVNLYVCGS